MSVSPTALQTAKAWLVDTVGLARDALHIYVGLALFLGSALLFRWPLKSWKPFAVVLAVALLGEAWDLRDSAALGSSLRLRESWKDVLNTSFWPLALLLLARWTQLFRR